MASLWVQAPYSNTLFLHGLLGRKENSGLHSYGIIVRFACCLLLRTLKKSASENKWCKSVSFEIKEAVLVFCLIDFRSSACHVIINSRCLWVTTHPGSLCLKHLHRLEKFLNILSGHAFGFQARKGSSKWIKLNVDRWSPTVMSSIACHFNKGQSVFWVTVDSRGVMVNSVSMIHKCSCCKL